jgi:transcription-repair coupling factor (superfamily II helicase)
MEGDPMDNIRQTLHQCDDYKKLNEALTANTALSVHDTSDDVGLLALTDWRETQKKTVFAVAPNLYKAQILYDKLSVFHAEDTIAFYPQDEFITTEMLVASLEFRLERMRTIQKILSGQPVIVVTHLSGILKPQMPARRWEDAHVRLKRGQEKDLETLKQTLVLFGYQHTYTVEKIGEFSVRGGIVDVFPMGEQKPCRLDFFGDEVETIRHFDIETQRSVARTPSVDIYPMNEFFYDDEQAAILKKDLEIVLSDHGISDAARQKIQRDIENIDNRENTERLMKYLGHLYDEPSTLLDLAGKPDVFFFDYHRILEQNEIITGELADWMETIGDYKAAGFSLMHGFRSLSVGRRFMFDTLEKASTSDAYPHRSFPASEPIDYHGNIDLFLSDMENRDSAETVLIALETEAMDTTVRNLLDDRGLPYTVLTEERLPSPGKINLIRADDVISLDVTACGLRVITERDLTSRKKRRRHGKYVSVFENSQRLSSVNELKPGDYVVHYDYGIGRFLEVKTMTLGHTKNDYIHIEYRNDDKLYIPLDAIDQIQKYAGSEGYTPRLSSLGGKDWERTKRRVRKKARDIADQLIDLYAKREQAEGYAFETYSDMENAFIETFPYEETVDQLTATNEVLSDMEKDIPMDRLLCGDVGFGKTEVAMRAAFRAVLNDKQVAYLAPTTVLSKQHYQTFKDRMDDFGVEVRLLNRFVSGNESKQVLRDLKDGRIDILIGTHRILSDDIHFKDLGLLIIDEEQRFGVRHKEKITSYKVSIDVLSLSATPIPRTLQMAIMGVKNMSVLETAPENRYPIQTYVLEQNDVIVKDAVERELARGGQVFYVYNRVGTIDEIARDIRSLVPEANVAIVHGKMHKARLERIVDDFIDKEIDVLVSTTIIETGIDIPNANTLIVHDAERLGLSQLYQIRGRVGRSDRIAYAYLMYPRNKILTEDAEKRLKVIKDFTQLGSGFKIAVRDLSIRGAGDVLGSEQSGFIDSVGIDVYMRILEEEIEDSQHEGEPTEEKATPGVKTDVSKYIDPAYVEDDFVKIEMHKKIHHLKRQADIDDLLNEFRDRFGDYDEDLRLYMYAKLFEHQTEELGVETIRERKTNVTLIVGEDASGELAGDALFKTGMDLSRHIRFAYKDKKINIILDTVGLKRHWLYTMVDFLEKIIT